jgi:hypothetical protein
MSITVTMYEGERQLSRIGTPQTMTQVMEYLRGWVAPRPISGSVIAEVQLPHQEPQRFALRVNGRNVTLLPQR